MFLFTVFFFGFHNWLVNRYVLIDMYIIKVDIDSTCENMVKHVNE